MHSLRALVVTTCFTVASAGLASAAAQGPPPAGAHTAALDTAARDVALVRHVRQHLAAPEDGVSLAADRVDLRSAVLRSSRADRGAPSPFDTLAVLVETWHRRVNERVPFAVMGPDALALVRDARRALAQSLGALTPAARQRYATAIDQELLALTDYLSGRGELPDEYIDRALMDADAATAGRPAPYAGPAPVPSPYGVRRPPVPYPGPPGPQPERPNPYGEYAEPAPDNPANPASGAGGPYGAAQAGGAGCRASRVVAGDAFTADAFLRNAECWSRMKMWPGWEVQVAEALDWAIDAAVITRDCAGLDAVARQTGSLGAGPTPFPTDRLRLVDVRRRVETERAWLASQGCR